MGKYNNFTFLLGARWDCLIPFLCLESKLLGGGHHTLPGSETWAWLVLTSKALSRGSYKQFYGPGWSKLPATVHCGIPLPPLRGSLPGSADVSLSLGFVVARSSVATKPSSSSCHSAHQDAMSQPQFFQIMVTKSCQRLKFHNLSFLKP